MKSFIEAELSTKLVIILGVGFLSTIWVLIAKSISNEREYIRNEYSQEIITYCSQYATETIWVKSSGK